MRDYRSSLTDIAEWTAELANGLESLDY